MDTTNVYLDLSILDSVTGGCGKAHTPAASPTFKQPGAGSYGGPITGGSAGIAPIGPTAPGSNADPMQTLAALGLGVLDLVDKGELDPNLLIAGMQDAFGSGDPTGGLMSSGFDHGVMIDPVHTTDSSASAPMHEVDLSHIGAVDGGMSTANSTIAPDHIHDHRPDHTRDHRGESQDQPPTGGHTTFNDVGNWNPLTR